MLSQPNEPLKWPLKTLYLYLTEGCNLRCRHCWLAPKYETPNHQFPTLDYALMIQIITEAQSLGLTGVKLTGGEPLMHPQISQILDFITQAKLRLIIETNGVLCTPKLAHKITENNQAFVSVSLDGIEAATHEWVRGVPGSFANAIAGIKNLVAAGLKPQIIMSIMKHNQPQILEMIDFAEKLGGGSIKFNIVMPTERGAQMHQQDETIPIAELIQLGAWMEKEVIPQAKIRVFYHHPPAFQSLGNMFGEEASGCSSCRINNIIGVLPNGAYSLCGIGSSIPELIFGKAPADSLTKVWLQNKKLHQIRQEIPAKLEGICSQCLMKQVCLGSCIAQNYYQTHSLWAPFWYCEAAQAAGLFPQNRLVPC